MEKIIIYYQTITILTEYVILKISDNMYLTIRSIQCTIFRGNFFSKNMKCYILFLLFFKYSLK